MLQRSKAIFLLSVHLVTIFVYIFCGLILSSCKSNTVTPSSVIAVADDNSDSLNSLYKSYEEAIAKNYNKSPRNETIALDFVLGQNKETALQNLESLKSAKKVVQDSEEEINWKRKNGGEIVYYAYRFNINDSIDFLMKIDLDFYKGRLSSLLFTNYASANNPEQDFKNLYDFMVMKFGQPHFIKHYREDGDENYYWFDGYKELRISRLYKWGENYKIKYSDLRAIAQKRSNTKAVDSIRDVNRKNELRGCKVNCVKVGMISHL